MTTATAEPETKQAEQTPEQKAAEQLAARVRAVDGSQNVSGKDAEKWTKEQRESVAALLDNPPKFYWEVHDKFAPAVEALGKTKTERLAATVLAKRLESFERLESELDEAFEQRRECWSVMETTKKAASEANKAYANAKEAYEAAERLIVQVAEHKRSGQLALPLEDVPEKPKGKGKKGKRNGESNGHTNGVVLNGKASNDPGATASVEVLNLGKRITDGMHAADIKTVADLEKLMSTDEWWHTKIKGVGTGGDNPGVDKVQDALIAYRKEHPVPTEEE